MGIEDTWYDYYRGPSAAPSFAEKIAPKIPTLTVNTAPLSPSPSFDPRLGSDYAPTLVNNVWRESERREAIKAKHGRERQFIALVIELLCQIAGFTCAIVFGVWAVKSYNVSVVALKVQTVANQIAMRSLCADDPTLASSEVCRTALGATGDQLWDASLMGNPMDGTAIETPKLSLGSIVGIAISSVAGVLILNIIIAIWRRRSMIMQLNSHVGTNLSNLECGLGSGPAPHGEGASTVTVTSTSTPYSGNPLTPSGTTSSKKQWIQPSHVLQIY